MTIPFRPITPTRLQAKGWARVGKPGAHLLRRGAWYPVVRISSSHIVVLDVNRRNVPVDRRFLEIRYHPPERWSIVRCEPREIQRVGRIFPLTYAVCPSCRHRQSFETESKELTCERCKKIAGFVGLDHPAQRPAAEWATGMGDLEHVEADQLATVRPQETDAAIQVVERESPLRVDQDILTGAAGDDPVTEALLHQGVVRSEADGHAVGAVFVLGVRVTAVVDVHQPGAVGPFAQHAIAANREPRDGEDRRRVVDARGLLPGLEGGALDLEADDAAEVAHVGNL